MRKILTLGLAASVAGCVAIQSPDPSRLWDVTDYRVIGQGCGVTDEQRRRVYIAVEEDDLPGPDCEVVTELVEREFSKTGRSDQPRI